jgi:hypothetical protein
MDRHPLHVIMGAITGLNLRPMACAPLQDRAGVI